MSMAEIPEDDASRLAEMMGARADFPRVLGAGDLARHLLEQGVTLPPPPPDPAVVVAEEVQLRAGGNLEFLLAAVRHLFTPEALAAAAAKVQEAHT